MAASLSDRLLLSAPRSVLYPMAALRASAASGGTRVLTGFSNCSKHSV